MMAIAKVASQSAGQKAIEAELMLAESGAAGEQFMNHKSRTAESRKRQACPLVTQK